MNEIRYSGYTLVSQEFLKNTVVQILTYSC